MKKGLPPPKTHADAKIYPPPERPFIVSFAVELENGYELKDMTLAHVKEFHRFLQDTVYKGLTVSEVDKLYLRKKGMGKTPPLKYKKDVELIHYGKSERAFRLFGYYSEAGYFVVCRIDGGHNTHKQ